jgi:carboxyl-terminal processing protease
MGGISKYSRWRLALGALVLLAAGLISGPVDAGLQAPAKPRPDARAEAVTDYRHLSEFGRAFEALAKGSQAEKIRGLDLFAEIFRRIQSHYWRRTEPKTLIDAASGALREQKPGAAPGALAITAARAMIQTLDPYSEFTAAKKRPKRKRGVKRKYRPPNFGNVGLEIFMKNGAPVIISPHDGSPASRAGLAPGDIITGVNGTVFTNPALGQVLDAMRGPVGSEVRLQMMRPGGKAFEARMVRAIAPGRTVSARLDGNVAVIRIASFAAHSTRDLRRRLKELRTQAVAKAARIDAVVLDLRNNSGGLLNQAISVADVFLDSGEIVSTRAASGRRNSKHRRFNARLGDALRGRPIAVIINGGSASAAEIVAGALQDLKRAIVVGEKSFGKGSVQTVIPIKGHGSLRLTTSHYYPPSGRSFDDVPIQPDVDAKACKRLTGARLRPGDDALIACALISVRLRARIGKRAR